MSVILYDNLWMLLLYHAYKFAQHCRLTDSGHILQTDFGCTSCNKLLCDTCVVFSGVDRRGGDTQCCLWCHAGLKCILDGWNDVANVVEPTEDACDVNSLCMLYAIHEFSDVCRYREHPKCVQTAVKHVSLDAYLVEWLCEGAYCLVRVFAI